ncbi:EcoKI restriction-modification system protein HsdS [Clostridium tepidiprofundi DSM 19306]|uniref:EcoKI restriction-modification system protein HsdS n=1 Tax=Clostridium tepidiprofundi DSM 19306 TaxID=1121338 RepID=A0A151AX51_9CLOT|nr:restriction endonuclease subunit S [Clostridium tepidiprofundi]KYH32225.1 EcoKI restriction-modification system protein HsdS [Clostridium tepidiprofundi DSM 19306]
MEEIRQIPEGWEKNTLGEIYEIVIGGTPSREESKYWYSKSYGGNLWVAISDLNKREITETREKLTNCGVKNSNVKRIPKGTVLMSFKLSIGRVAFAGKDLYTNEAIAGFIKKSKFEADNVYLYYGLQQWNLLKEVDQAIKGATLNKEKIKKVEGLFPELKEQQKIARILSTLDQNIEKTEQTIEKYKKIKNGLMDDLLIGKIRFKDSKWVKETEFKEVEGVGRIPKDWEYKTFDKISRVRQGLQIAIDNRYKKEGENRYVYITVQYLNDIQDETNLFYIENPKESVVCKKEDILMTRTGNTGQVITNVEGVFHNNFFLIDFDKSKVIRDYLYYYLNIFFIQNLISVYAGTTTIPDLNHGDFYKLPICFPMQDEQKQIINILSKQDQLIEKEQQYLEKLKKLKSGLMEDLLTGKVRVKVEE